MIKFDFTKEINGEQLAEELGIDNSQLWADEKYLYIEADITQAKAQKIFDAHVMKPMAEPTIQEKLAAAGIDLDDLRVALGL